jgi:hypothetical protein
MLQEIMRPFYAEGCRLNTGVDTDTEDFYGIKVCLEVKISSL